MVNSNKSKKRDFIVKPIHPGAILREEILIPQDISPQQLAQVLKVPKEQIKWVCEERGDITPDLAVRLSIYFGSSVEIWLNLQRSYDREVVARNLDHLKREIEPYPYKKKRKSSVEFHL